MVPAVVHWPGKLKVSTVMQRVTVQDVLPTLAELVEAPLLPDQVLDGASHWSTINAHRGASDADFVAVSRKARAVLSGHWKLIASGGDRELYNLANDPYETTNLVSEQPMLVQQLQQVIDRIPQRDSINQSMFKIVMDMDKFGGEEDREPWADVVKQP